MTDQPGETPDETPGETTDKSDRTNAKPQARRRRQTDKPADNPADKPPATVRAHGDYHLVTYGTWEISIAPDGLLMLPRHLHPREVADFVACAAVAADVGADKIADNERKAAENKTVGLSGRRAIVTEGPPPAGAVRMKTTPRQHQGSIGRRQQRSS